MIDEPRMGVYKHYKGGLYQVLGLAHDANFEGRECVVYIPLQLSMSQTGPRLAVRTVEDFVARLHLSDRSVCPYAEHCSHREPRFRFLGPVLEAWMMKGLVGDA